jgi:hypothetical protein
MLFYKFYCIFCTGMYICSICRYGPGAILHIFCLIFCHILHIFFCNILHILQIYYIFCIFCGLSCISILHFVMNQIKRLNIFTVLFQVKELETGVAWATTSGEGRSAPLRPATAACPPPHSPAHPPPRAAAGPWAGQAGPAPGAPCQPDRAGGALCAPVARRARLPASRATTH